MTLRKKLFGDKAFYKMVLAIAVPMMLQNGISNFVSMLDNIMVGAVGTEAMSGVSIVNQLNNIFMFSMFGAVGGIGIFTAQYYGKGDTEGVRKTFRFKLFVGAALTALFMFVFYFFMKTLVGSYLYDTTNGGDLELAMESAVSYFRVLLLSFPAFFLLQVYASTLRECSETMVPMQAGIVAVFVNLGLNYLLIYGKLGFPELGVRGAAIATVIARYVEVGIVIIWAHTHSERQSWVKSVYRTLAVPKKDIPRFLVKALPLLANEICWSIGQAVLTQCYSTRGLTVVAGLNIAVTLNNCVNIIYFTMGSAVGIIIGQILGTGDLKKAKDADAKMITFSVLCSFVSSAILLLAALFFPEFYNVTAEAKTVARQFIYVYACVASQHAFLQATYFTLRAGGRTGLTVLYDSGAVWFLSIPVAFLLSRFTTIPAVWIFVFVSVADIGKIALGCYFLKKNVWLNNIVSGG